MLGFFCHHISNSELVNDLFSKLWHLHYCSCWFPANVLPLLFLREVKEQQKKEAAVTLSYTRALKLVERAWIDGNLWQQHWASGEELPRPCLCPGLGGGSGQLSSAAILALFAVSKSLKTEIQSYDYSHYIYYPRSNQLNTGKRKKKKLITP